MDAEIRQYIDVMAENTALKIEKKIDESIRVHSEHCGNQFSGRMELVEDAVIRMANRQKSRLDQFGPVLAVILRNWKVMAVVAAVFMTLMGNFKSGKPMTVEQIKEVIKQVQSADVSAKTIGSMQNDTEDIRRRQGYGGQAESTEVKKTY